MAVRSPTLSVDDQEYYPLHEEDDVPEIPPHRRWVADLANALEARLPGWFITGNVCIYWERGNTKKYRAPDLLAVKEPLTEEVHRVYLAWQQPPVTFVAEVGSKSTFRRDEGPKVAIYRDLIRAEEYLYADPPKGVLRLWRRGHERSGGGFVEAPVEASGRVRSAALGLAFGLEEGDLRVYTLEGERLLTHKETDAAWQEAERQRQEAERQRQAEAARRREAEQERQEEAARRQEAEAARAAAEARAAELERQLAELRARLGDRGTEEPPRAGP